MQLTQPARNQEPFFEQAQTADRFEGALKQAVRLNAASMQDLHDAIKICMCSLRDQGMQCEAALLTMKACIRHIGRKHRLSGSAEIVYSDLLLQQITRWCILEFYRSEPLRPD